LKEQLKTSEKHYKQGQKALSLESKKAKAAARPYFERTSSNYGKKNGFEYEFRNIGSKVFYR
jgi:hypothetical protein